MFLLQRWPASRSHSYSLRQAAKHNWARQNMQKQYFHLLQDYRHPDCYHNNVDGGTNHDLSLCYVDCIVNLTHVLCVTTVTQYVCQLSEISSGRFKMNVFSPFAPILPHLHTRCIVLPLNWWTHPVISRHPDLSKQENHKGNKNNTNNSHRIRRNSALAPKGEAIMVFSLLWHVRQSREHWRLHRSSPGNHTHTSLWCLLLRHPVWFSQSIITRQQN